MWKSTVIGSQVALLAAAVCAAEPLVSLEVATEPGFAITEARAWSEMLGQAGFTGVRIRGATAGDQPSIETSGNQAARSYHVVGILTSDNILLLPQGRFSLSDRARIEQWLTKLRTDGVEGITVKPAAFGLLPRQLLTVHEAFTVPVDFSTAGKQPRDVAKQISDRLPLKFITDASGQAALATEEVVADELQGLSSGTALAALLRPLGLVLVPEKSGSDIRLRIADSRTAKEHWPVGWPPKGNPRETLPDLFKFLNVEVAQTPVSEVLNAVGGRLKAPILIDRNSLARHKIDLATKVDLPKTNTFYDAVLDRLLFQAKLRYEIRVDEAGKPFLWVTTVRRQ